MTQQMCNKLQNEVLVSESGVHIRVAAMPCSCYVSCKLRS